MVLKQFAFTKDEADILYDLVFHEIRTNAVFGSSPDTVEIMRVLIGLHDRLDIWEPPESIIGREIRAEIQKDNKKPNDKKVRRSSQTDMQEEE